MANSRAAKKYVHNDPKIEAEFKNVYSALSSLDTGAFRFLPVTSATTSYLYVQLWSETNRRWESMLRISNSGDVNIEGSFTDTDTLSDEGNG